MSDSDSAANRVPEYRTYSSREVYRSRWMSLREDEIVRADGTAGIYGVLDKPDFAIVIPRHEDGSFTLVEQFRYPVGERCLEFPQGADETNADMDPLELARKELAEETGLRAASVTLLGRLHHAHGYSTQAMSIVLATGLTQGETERETEEQGMTVARVAGDVVADMIRDGRIRDSSTVAAYGMLRLSKC
jgi:8-oxo-dGTP pyrophosphatase MutT (NUDIX family)